jgi:hypothetical protein
MDGDRADCRQREHSRGRSLRCRGVFQELSAIRARDFGDAQNNSSVKAAPELRGQLQSAQNCPETAGCAFPGLLERRAM